MNDFLFRSQIEESAEEASKHHLNPLQPAPYSRHNFKPIHLNKCSHKAPKTCSLKKAMREQPSDTQEVMHAASNASNTRRVFQRS